jgi:hypothetical protein
MIMRLSLSFITACLFIWYNGVSGQTCLWPNTPLTVVVVSSDGSGGCGGGGGCVCMCMCVCIFHKRY